MLTVGSVHRLKHENKNFKDEVFWLVKDAIDNDIKKWNPDRQLEIWIKY